MASKVFVSPQSLAWWTNSSTEMAPSCPNESAMDLAAARACCGSRTPNSTNTCCSSHRRTYHVCRNRCVVDEKGAKGRHPCAPSLAHFVTTCRLCWCPTSRTVDLNVAHDIPLNKNSFNWGWGHGSDGNCSNFRGSTRLIYQRGLRPLEQFES